MNLITETRKFLLIDSNTDNLFKIFNQIRNSDSIYSNETTHSQFTQAIIIENLSTLTSRSDELFEIIELSKLTTPQLDFLRIGDYLLDKQFKIYCMPFGFLNSAIKYLLPKEIDDLFINLLICPSGNKGNGTVLSPGIHPKVFTVGAIDKHGKVAPFSGRMYDEHGNCLKPEVCALGVDVEVELEDGSKYVVNGTSFACAQVAGVAAALFEANPEATVNDVKMALIESCTPAEGSRFGNINPEKALELIKTKVPYQEQFQPIPEPEWVNEQYVDYRLISQCNRARKKNKNVEGLVVGEDTDALIKRLEQEMGEHLSEYNPFTNFDMAHIIAKPEFYDALFEQPDLEVASAVDINYFDM